MVERTADIASKKTLVFCQSYNWLIAKPIETFASIGIAASDMTSQERSLAVAALLIGIRAYNGLAKYSAAAFLERGSENDAKKVKIGVLIPYGDGILTIGQIFISLRRKWLVAHR